MSESGIEHLRKSLEHAEEAATAFPDDSRQESVAENVVAWARRSVEIAEREEDGPEVRTDGGEPQETGSERIDRRAGESDMITFERIGVPEPGLRIEQVGSDPDIRYRYDWDDRGEPVPEDFERIGHVEVKLVAAMPDMDGEVREAADEAHEAIVDLKDAMCDARDLDDEQRQEVLMGNLDGLPEVERHVE